MRRIGSAVSATMPTTGIRAAAEPQEVSCGESPQRGNSQHIAQSDEKLVRRGNGEFLEPVSKAYCNTERKLVRQPFATVQAVERSPKHRHFGGQHPSRSRRHRKCLNSIVRKGTLDVALMDRRYRSKVPTATIRRTRRNGNILLGIAQLRNTQQIPNCSMHVGITAEAGCRLAEVQRGRFERDDTP